MNSRTAFTTSAGCGEREIVLRPPWYLSEVAFRNRKKTTDNTKKMQERRRN